MKHKFKVGDEVLVQRGTKGYHTKIIRLGEKNGMPVYDTDDGHWCYGDQILGVKEASQDGGIKLSKEQAEKIAELLRGYYSALDNILYDKFSYEDLQKMLNDIDDLALAIERQL